MKSETIERSPAEIESRIEEKRADLERKLEQLEQRLSPREQFGRMKARINPERYIGWVALGAVVAGGYLAVKGWRRAHQQVDGNAACVKQAELEEEEIGLLDCGSSESPQVP
jgi:hypothetical protein